MLDATEYEKPSRHAVLYTFMENDCYVVLQYKKYHAGTNYRLCMQHGLLRSTLRFSAQNDTIAFFKLPSDIFCE